MTESNTIKLGPAGRKDGSTWNERGRSEIVQIFIWHCDQLGITCIQFQYSDDNGKLVLSAKYGSCGYDSPKFDVVQFDYPSEYITSMSGSYYNDLSKGIASLKFGTNRRDYGPFGRCQSNVTSAAANEIPFQLGKNVGLGPFGLCQSNVTSAAANEFPFQLGKNDGPFGLCQSNVTSAAAMKFHFQLGKNGRQFDGFHGTHGLYVSSIGVYFKPITLLSSLQKGVQR